MSYDPYKQHGKPEQIMMSKQQFEDYMKHFGSNKPKEFWARKHRSDPHQYHVSADPNYYSESRQGVIHVIEHSAYKAMVDKNQKMMELIEACEKRLDRYRHLNQLDAQGRPRAYAEEALDLIKKWREG